MKIKVIVTSKNKNKNYDLSAAIDGAITYTGQMTGSASKITFDVIKEGEMIFHEGDKVTIYEDEKPYIVCFIFSKSKAQEKISVVAYDILRYMQYKQSYSFKGMTASKILTQIANEFELPVGEIEDTKYVLSDKIYEDKTLLDIATDALMRTSVQTGKVYVLFDELGSISLKEVENRKSPYIIGNKSFATDYTYITSIEDSYNYIKLVKPNKDSGKTDTYVALDPEKVKTWGKLQYYKKVDEKMNEAQIKDFAANLLKHHAQTQRNLKITALGISQVKAGTLVLIDIQDLGDIALKKMLLIEKCTHRISDDHTMDLEMKVYNG